MRPIKLAVVVSMVLALLTPGAYAYAATDPAPNSAAGSPRSVLRDVADSLAERDRSPATLPSNAKLPGTAAEVAEVDTSAGTLTMGVPAKGRDLAGTDRAMSLFRGEEAHTTIAVQGVGDGLRALVHIDSPTAPQRYEFQIGGDVSTLRHARDGGVAALNSAGAVVATAPAPWAIDALGNSVPTHFEIAGDTLIQVVDHHAGTFAYGIVADPWWNPFSWNWNKVGSYIAKGAKMTAKVAMCASAIGLAVYPGAKAYKAIKELGGVKKAAQLFVGAGKISDVKKLLPGAAENILGIAAVKKYCF